MQNKDDMDYPVKIRAIGWFWLIVLTPFITVMAVASSFENGVSYVVQPIIIGVLAAVSFVFGTGLVLSKRLALNVLSVLSWAGLIIFLYLGVAGTYMVLVGPGATIILIALLIPCFIAICIFYFMGNSLRSYRNILKHKNHA